eukprot:TRINITY_DN5797_c0_g1_i5.p1 TRINITY_DN5797_c0_g1~~TRINITY_DN5797_c0_g1_i5.p1  ORF type:complete len:632 (+),score=105.83 TRINITY_DN5797_c0_g1_i5:679-2574(+)
MNERVAFEAAMQRKKQSESSESSTDDSSTDWNSNSVGSDLILPVYIWYLLLVAATFSIQGISNALIPLDSDEQNPWDTCFLYASIWSIQRFSIEAIAFFLLQPGAGIDAMKKACIPTIFVSIITFFSLLYTFRNLGSTMGFVIQLLWELSLMGFYAGLLFLTPHRFFARPAIRPYARFWVFFRGTQAISITLKHFDCGLGFCMYDLSVGLLFGICRPIALYRTFVVDSKYWQGLVSMTDDDEPARPKTQQTPLKMQQETTQNTPQKAAQKLLFPTSPMSDIQTPLLGIPIEASSAVALVRSMNQSRVKVKLLNYNRLSIVDQNSPLGSGGTSRVYKGIYKGRYVAIKVVYCLYLTPVTISNFFREATILSGLRHKNVVYVEGVCIVPPAISLVLEYCAYGSLFDFLTNDNILRRSFRLGGRRPSISNSTHSSSKAPKSPSISTILKRDKPIDSQTRLLMAADCFRGVSFLHAQNPPILHKDIKSLNFLVDEDLNVKIADLELSSEKSLNEREDAMLPSTVHWTAPELMKEKRSTYNEKCDIYSTAIVFWEIMTSEIPFRDHPDFRHKAALAQQIAGPRALRPTIRNDFPSHIREILEAAWHPEPMMRPSAREMCEAIESLPAEISPTIQIC